MTVGNLQSPQSLSVLTYWRRGSICWSELQGFDGTYIASFHYSAHRFTFLFLILFKVISSCCIMFVFFFNVIVWWPSNVGYNSILFLCSPRPLKKTGVVSFLLLNGSLSADLLAMSCRLHSILFIECLFWARLWSMPWESLGNKTARSLLRGLLVAGLGIFCLSARPVFPTLHLPTSLEAWPHHRLPSTLASTKATYLCLSYNLSCPKHVLLFLSILYTELFLYILVKTLTLSNPNSWLKKKNNPGSKQFYL